MRPAAGRRTRSTVAPAEDRPRDRRDQRALPEPGDRDTQGNAVRAPAQLARGPGVARRPAVVRQGDGVESRKGRESGFVRERLWTSADTARANRGRNTGLTPPRTGNSLGSKRLWERDGGPDGGRTRDLVNAIHARSQLRHWPIRPHSMSAAGLRSIRRACPRCAMTPDFRGNRPAPASRGYAPDLGTAESAPARPMARCRRYTPGPGEGLRYTAGSGSKRVERSGWPARATERQR